jgi:hypothetical protein
MNIKIIYFIYISSVFSIGLDALNIPLNSVELSTHNSTDLGVNSLSELFNENSYLEYNTRNWLPGITGHSIFWKTSSKLIKSVDFEMIIDDEIFFHGDIPNDEEIVKLPASWYSLSFLIGHKLKSNNFGIKFQTFSNLLYSERTNGLITNFYFNTNINKKIQLDISLQNSILLARNLNNQQSPKQLSFQLQNNHFKVPISYGLGMNLSNLENSFNLFLNYDYEFFKFISSMKYIKDENLQFGGGVEIIYTRWKFSYSISNHLTSTLGFPQMFSIQYNI